MKKTVLLLVSIIFLTSLSFSKDNPKDKPYFKEVERLVFKKKRGIFNLNLDLFGGITITNTTFDVRTGDTTAATSLNTTSSKVGPSAGALLSVDFLGYGFTTGMAFVGKGFQDSSGTNRSLNYLNIPLLFYFDFDFDKVIIDGNVGPYFGLLLSQDESTLYKVKNFDFGLTGSIQGAYMFKRPLGVLFGLKYEYGGLNNLGNNESIQRIRTSSFFIYTGLKFVM
jgi:hypothetical protein